MKKLLLMGVALSILGAADFSMAADIPVYLKAPPVAPWSWTGFYVGGNVGYSWGRALPRISIEGSSSTSVVTRHHRTGIHRPLAGNGATATVLGSAFGSASADMDGWLGGAQAGYNRQSDQWVYGVEGDFQLTGESDDPLFCGTPGCPLGSAFGTSTTKLPWFAPRSAPGPGTHGTPDNTDPRLPVPDRRVGYRRDQLDLYGGIGRRTSRFHQSEHHARRMGGRWRGEGRLGHTNWTLKLEYLYMDFGSVSGTLGSAGAPVITPFGINNSDQIHFITTTTGIIGVANTHVTDQVLRLGLNYKFPPK